MRYSFLYILVTLLFLYSCETRWGKYDGYKMEYDSKLEYYIVLDKSDTLSICSWDSLPNVTPYPGAYLKFHKANSTVDTSFIALGGIVIDTYVNEVHFDKKFIIVDQKLLGKICECNPECLKEKYGRESHTATSFEFCREALRNSDIHDYWIIRKKTNDVYGPYTQEQYLIKRKELEVPDKTRFDFE